MYDSKTLKMIHTKRNKTTYLYNTGEIINGLTILQTTRSMVNTKATKSKITYQKSYQVKCITDGFVYKIKESHLAEGKGCPVCKNKRIAKGINDIATTNPEYICYFANKDDVYNFCAGSRKKTLLKCPICNSTKKMYIYSLFNNGFSCPCCGDGISYPEKFVYAVVSKFAKTETQYSPLWIRPKRYDFYITMNNLIIETHGEQHYKENTGFKRMGGMTLNDVTLNDKLKRELALSNGIQHYIELDCRKSNMEWIKNSIMNSELPKLLNFKEEDIDWVECEKIANKNIMIEVCKHYNTFGMPPYKIEEFFEISHSTISSYLKRGAMVGLCNYSVEKSRENGVKLRSGDLNKNSKPVVCDNKEFANVIECAEYYKVNKGTMSQWINGRCPIPVEWYDKGLRLKDKDIESYSVNYKSNRKILFNKIVFSKLKDVSVNCGLSPSTLSSYLNGKAKMPQKYIDLGLRYATEEDLKLYKEVV